MTAKKKKTAPTKPQAETKARKPRKSKATPTPEPSAPVPEPLATEVPATDPGLPTETPVLAASDEVAAPEASPAPDEAVAPSAVPTPTEANPATSSKDRKSRAAKPAPEPKERKPGALDAAAQVLAEAGTPMTCKGMIEAMAAKGYWSSPNGKTPEATLYAAILKEITSKRSTTRFQKTGRGLFALREERA